MAVRYLYPSGRFTELIMSGYTTLFGCWIINSAFKGSGALEWTGWSQDDQLLFGSLLAFFGILHSVGVNVNGRWWASPFLRLLGMSLAGVMSAVLSVASENVLSSSVFTYGFIFFWYLIASGNAMRDSATAIRMRIARRHGSIF